MLALNILFGVLLGAVAAFLAATSIQLVNTNGELRYEVVDNSGNIVTRKFSGFNTLGAYSWVAVVGIGLAVGAIFVLSPMVGHKEILVPEVGVVLLILMVAISVIMAIYAATEVSSVIEAIPFLVMAGFLWVLSIPVAGYATVIADPFWTSVINVVPPIVFAGSVGAILASWLFYRYEENGETKDRVLGWSAVAAAVVAVCLIAGLGIAWGNVTSASSAYADEVASEIEQDTKAINALTYEDIENLEAADIASVSRSWDDFSLPTHNAERVAATGCSDGLARPVPSRESITDGNLRNVSLLMTKCLFWEDKQIVGKKVWDLVPCMREFVATTKEKGIFVWLEWADEKKSSINVSKDFRLIAAKVDAFEKLFVYQGVQTRTTIENWCLPAPTDNNWCWGEKATCQYTDEFHVFAYVGKNERGNAQATGLFVFGINVHDSRPAIFGVTPEIVTVTGTPSGNPSNPGNPGNPSPGPGPNPNPNPDPDDNPKKNPDDLMDREDYTNPNDDTGPGEKTIGDDPNHSTKDTPDSSTSMDHSQYRDDMNQKDEANNGSQREAGESNAPSTPTPSGANVDNAGAEAANHASQIPNEASTADGSAVTKPEKSGGDGAWGGPTD